MPSQPIRSTPLRFYGGQLLVLAVAALVLIGVFEFTSIDLWLSDYYFDWQSHRFPLQESWVLTELNHRYLKYGIILLAFGLLIGAWRSREPAVRRMRLFLFVAMLAVPSTVGILKHYSERPCPWDTDRYSGTLPHLKLWESLPAGAKPGQCFPGGHSSGGFGTMAFFFLWWGRSRAKAYAALAGGFTLGMVMGWGQLMRGAHFLSHNLWSAWVAWAVILVLHAAWFGRSSESTGDSLTAATSGDDGARRGTSVKIEPAVESE